MGDSISLRRTNTFCKKKTKNQEKQKKRYYGQAVAQASDDAAQVDSWPQSQSSGDMQGEK